MRSGGRGSRRAERPQNKAIHSTVVLIVTRSVSEGELVYQRKSLLTHASHFRLSQEHNFKAGTSLSTRSGT